MSEMRLFVEDYNRIRIYNNASLGISIIGRKSSISSLKPRALNTRQRKEQRDACSLGLFIYYEKLIAPPSI